MCFVEVLLWPLKWFLVEDLGFVELVELLVEVALGVVHGPVVRVGLLEGGDYLDGFLEHLLCAFDVFYHYEVFGISTAGLGIHRMVEPKLLLSQHNSFFEVFIKLIYPAHKHLRTTF